MSPVTATSTVGALSNTTTTGSNTLNTDDFLQIMLAELTNQDPLEPMTNKDLLDQIAGIQQLQSNETMTNSFGKITNQFGSFMNQLDNFLERDQLSSAGKMIGEIVAGTTTAGNFTVGKVIAVNINNNKTLLELDTGELIDINEMTRLGGTNSEDIIGTFVIGKNSSGANAAGIVESIETNGNDVTLRLSTGEEVSLKNCTLVSADTAYVLLGMFAEGNDVQGNVESYRISGAGIEGITLLLEDGSELPLTEVTDIRSV